MMNKLKPALAAALAAAMLTGTAFAAPIYAAAPPIFSDVPTKHWGYQFVQRAAQEKLVTGTGNGKFAPESTVSTAEWATMICALMYPDAAAKQPAGDEWWSPYVSALVENDVLVGTNTYIATRTWAASDPAVAQSKLKIAAQLPMQRMEMAAVIHNVAQDMGWNTDTDPAIGSTAIPDAPAPTAPPPTTPPQPSTAAVKDMIQIATISENYYEITVNNDTISGKLSNGKDINEKNINAMVDEILGVFPVGSSWADDTKVGKVYRYGDFAHVVIGGGCAGFTRWHNAATVREFAAHQ